MTEAELALPLGGEQHVLNVIGTAVWIVTCPVHMMYHT